MIILVGSSALLALLITLIIFRNTIRREAVKHQQIERLQGRSPDWDDELSKSFGERVLVPAWNKLTGVFSKIAKRRKSGKGRAKPQNMRLENDLRLAGIHMQPNEFVFMRILATAGFLLVGFVTAVILTSDSSMQFLIILVTMAIAVAAPAFFLRYKVNKRQLGIQNQMPNIMDVLSVSIEAGLGFDAALLKVIDHFDGPLVEELALVYREIQMGLPRRDALSALSQRSRVTELQTFASAVIQSEQFGTPIKNVLRNQAQQIRVSRRQQAQEKGMKAPIKMMLPMVLFIFPVVFIILLGPTVIQAIGQFS